MDFAKALHQMISNEKRLRRKSWRDTFYIYYDCENGFLDQDDNRYTIMINDQEMIDWEVYIDLEKYLEKKCVIIIRSYPKIEHLCYVLKYKIITNDRDCYCMIEMDNDSYYTGRIPPIYYRDGRMYSDKNSDKNSAYDIISIEEIL